MEVDDFLPLSGLQHLIFCERQFALIHVEQLWAENALTTSGRVLHERADLPGQSRSRDVKTVRALQIRSDRLRLSGRADVVEFRREAGPDGLEIWRPFPVEYKLGRPKTGGADEVQLCAQAICLEEATGLEVPHGALFYGKTRRRKEVEFTPQLRARVVAAANRAHELFDARLTPLATRHKGCDSCSLLDLCLPQVTADRAHGDGVDFTRCAELQEDLP
jgi:CRISPR-associated exonuclease Cas4